MTAVLGTVAAAVAASGRTGSTFSVLWLCSQLKTLSKPKFINFLAVYTYIFF
jgi:hypothetical protein